MATVYEHKLCSELFVVNVIVPNVLIMCGIRGCGRACVYVLLDRKYIA